MVLSAIDNDEEIFFLSKSIAKVSVYLYDSSNVFTSAVRIFNVLPLKNDSDGSTNGSGIGR